jgi:hypothetical protein
MKQVYNFSIYIFDNLNCTFSGKPALNNEYIFAFFIYTSKDFYIKKTLFGWECLCFPFFRKQLVF